MASKKKKKGVSNSEKGGDMQKKKDREEFRDGIHFSIKKYENVITFAFFHLNIVTISFLYLNFFMNKIH